MGDGSVWIADDRGRALRIDPVTAATIRFDVASGFAWRFLVHGGRVWFGSREIRLLDPSTLEVVDTVNPGGQFVDAALDPSSGTLWVAAYEDDLVRIDLR